MLPSRYLTHQIITKAQSTTTIAEEIQILRPLNNPHVVKLREIYESEEFIFIVMNNIKDGSLLSLIKSR